LNDFFSYGILREPVKHINGAELKISRTKKYPRTPTERDPYKRYMKNAKKLVRYQSMVHRKLEQKTMYKKKVGIGLGKHKEECDACGLGRV